MVRLIVSGRGPALGTDANRAAQPSCGRSHVKPHAITSARAASCTSRRHNDDIFVARPSSSPSPTRSRPLPPMQRRSNRVSIVSPHASPKLKSSAEAARATEAASRERLQEVDDVHALVRKLDLTQETSHKTPSKWRETHCLCESVRIRYEIGNTHSNPHWVERCITTVLQGHHGHRFSLSSVRCQTAHTARPSQTTARCPWQLQPHSIDM
jgi:hypothetical protein